MPKDYGNVERSWPHARIRTLSGQARLTPYSQREFQSDLREQHTLQLL